MSRFAHIATASFLVLAAALAFSRGAEAACEGTVDVNNSNVLSDSGDNTCIGTYALGTNDYGEDNTAIGYGALSGLEAGNRNIAIGALAGSEWIDDSDVNDDNIAIGHVGVSDDYATIRIGTPGTHEKIFVAGIGNNLVLGDVQHVVLGPDGQLGVMATADPIPGLNIAMIGAGALENNEDGGDNNTASGVSALNKNTTGDNNTAAGYQALFSNQTGDNNTAHGVAAMFNATGSNNTALGWRAGLNWTNGSNNIAIGNAGTGGDNETIRIGSTQTRAFMAGILGNPIGGGQTVVIGADGQLGVAPAATVIPGENVTMIGTGALASNQPLGVNNTAAGVNALNQNTTGGNNTASGMNALNRNSTGGANTASGVAALQQNTTGNNNTASGINALNKNTTGGNNTATGAGAIFANTTGSNNTALGFEAGKNWTTGSNNIAIGHAGAAGESNTIRIGGTQTTVFFSGIYATKVTKTRPVLINANGQLGTSRSSLRYKEDVHTMGDASNALLDLRPVTYRYKQAEADGSKPVQYGLIAEEVAEVMPDLVVYDEQGRPDSVSYEILPSLLLSEYQKQNHKLATTEAKLAAAEAILAQTRTELAGSKARLEAMEAEFAALKLAVSRLAAAPSAIKIANAGQ